MKELRTRESVTDDEIEMLEQKFLGKDLGGEETGKKWVYTGYCYQNSNNLSDGGEFCWQHPNREFLIKRYLKEINDEIGEYNTLVQDQWKADEQKYG